jgi:hypothetical protein
MTQPSLTNTKPAGGIPAGFDNTSATDVRTSRNDLQQNWPAANGQSRPMAGLPAGSRTRPEQENPRNPMAARPGVAGMAPGFRSQRQANLAGGLVLTDQLDRVYRLADRLVDMVGAVDGPDEIFALVGELFELSRDLRIAADLAAAGGL